MNIEVVNGIINDSEIEFDDYNRLVCWFKIHMEDGCGCIHALTLDKFEQFLNILEIRSYTTLIGCPIKVYRKDNLVIGVGNFLNTDWIEF